MAIDMCSEISSPVFSPRISFSHDLNHKNPVPTEAEHRLDSSLLDSNSDFNFCIVNDSLTLELSSADELFSNGRILPSQIKNDLIVSKETHQQHSQPDPVHHSSTAGIHTEKKKIRLKELLSTSFDGEEEDDDHQQKPTTTKSFWQFRRSSSLNFDTGRGKSLIKSLHFLSRSNSTGSAPNAKQATTSIPKEMSQRPSNLQRQPSVSSRRSSSCSSNYYSTTTQKTSPLRRNGSYGNGVRINPVLNLPPPYISKVTISFFGFGSLFCSGKKKKK
ncbi:hypothetical protein FNV43_RR26627 [Rhamnella rubrinervis]|uniref:Uncharacterized protein n=1 Tax=Rhamnella rubrinervis TaxID=2594499 RepID=A0A8K0GNY3_9ROSA|nr:hypothetical protein FNV43_RR26627 [Rhamnella rubrinervis]